VAGETPSDYLGRIRAGGDFATSEVTKHQSRADQAEANYRKAQEWLGSLEQYREQFSGEDIVNHLTNYNKILTDPRLRQVVDGFLQNGSVALPGSATSGEADEDEFLTDEQREIRELKAHIAQMDSRVATQESGAGAQALQRHLESFFAQWPVAPEVAERVRAKLTKDVTQWARQGEAGRKALELLQGANGAAQISAMALPVLTDDEQVQAVTERNLRKQRGLGSLSTDGPSPAGASSGTEPPPVFKSSLEALQYARANPEKHGSF
jgi:hypothetical protein